MNSFETLFPQQLKPIQEKVFYKYKNITSENSFNYLLDSLKNKYFYFSHPNQLNDPFDANVPNSYDCSDDEIATWLAEHRLLNMISINDVRKKIKDGSLIKKLDEAAEKERSNFCVLSLCASDVNEILWGTYTDSYSGICLGYKGIQFDYEKIDNENIYYIESVNINATDFVPELRIINKKRYFFIRPVLYDNDGKHKYNNFKKEETIKNIEYNIYHKKTIWKTENEFRAIVINNPLSKKCFDQKIFYGDNTLCEIIFGYNCSEEKRTKIMEVVKNIYQNNSVKFYEIKPNLNTFSLEKEEIQ